MSLARLGLAWALCAAWFLVWEQVERRADGRADGQTGGEAAWFRAPIVTYLLDALLLTLFASLWFASLGHGGWLLLFLLLSLLIEGPARYRDRPEGMGFSAAAIGRLLLGVIRIAGAGALLAWRL